MQALDEVLCIRRHKPQGTKVNSRACCLLLESRHLPEWVCRYDSSAALHVNTGLPSPLLSRFDVVLLLRDDPVLA